ncbi:MAG: hypothetical protein RL571_1395 [Pseudomonadota bacterium]|jgi:predicted short-subunit dehydrogenase-like oxidoreductase (DUF2520 family)
MKTLNIIGPGRLGKSLARLAQQSGRFQIGGVYARSAHHIAEAIAFIGAGEFCSALDQLPAADLYLIAVPDGAIADLAIELAACHIVKAGNVVFHGSGVSESALLAPLQDAGAYLASLHPAFSFADPALAVASFNAIPCALEGDLLACDILHDFVLALGGKPFTLAKGGKVAYHASLTMAANYLVTLADLSLKTAQLAGIEDDIAQCLILNLMQQTLSNIKVLGPAAALTGPITRGDETTIEKHLAVLKDATILRCYQSMGQATIDLAADHLSKPKQAVLHQLLA